MKAKKGTRYDNDNRTRLEEVIPLDTPFILFVDPSSACNLKCDFCPCGGAHKNLWEPGKSVNIMSYELYRKIIDDVSQFPQKLKVLRLYKEGEPLLNKRLPDMINYAKKMDVADSVDFTTNGTLLNPDLNLALIDAGIDRINISIESLDREGYLATTGVNIDFNGFLKNLEHLYLNKQQCHIFLKTPDINIKNEYDEEMFYKKFGDLCDEIAIEHITPVWPEFDLSHIKKDYKTSIYGDELTNVQVCPYIFYSICINSDGSVSACLMDWNHKLVVDNIRTNSLLNIWRNPQMQELRTENLKGNRCKIPVCNNCGQLIYAVRDNIDDYRDILLQKILK